MQQITSSPRHIVRTTSAQEKGTRNADGSSPSSPTPPFTRGSNYFGIWVFVTSTALQLVLTRLLEWAVARYALQAPEEVQQRYKELYREGGSVKKWTVTVFIVNIAQTVLAQILTCSSDEGSRDVAGTACAVNIVALLLYAFYTRNGGIALDLVRSHRSGGAVSGKRYVMWAITTPSLIRAVGIRAKLADRAWKTSLSAATSPRMSQSFCERDEERLEEETPVSKDGMGASPYCSTPASAFSCLTGRRFLDEQAARVASHVMYVTGFLGTAGFVWDNCWDVVPVALLVCSFIAFFYCSAFIWCGMNEATLRTELNSEFTKDVIRNLFLVTFSVFPLAHILSFTGFIDPILEEQTYCYGDMFMKVIILGNVAVENVFETSEHILRRQKEMRTTHMVEQLSLAVKNGDRFISMVSHELRTPIHGIMGLAEALLIKPEKDVTNTRSQGCLSDRATPAELTSLQAIVKSGRKLLDLVNNLLAHGSLRAGGTNLVVEKRVFDIVEVVNRCVEMRELYLSKNVKLTAEIDDGLVNDRDRPDSASPRNSADGQGKPSGRQSMDGDRSSPTGKPHRLSGKSGWSFSSTFTDKSPRTVLVVGDPMRIEQVIINLLNNAIAHTPKGFVRLIVRRAKPSEVLSSLFPDDNDDHETEDDGDAGDIAAKDLKRDHVVIEVHDTGCGIPAEDTENIFQMFHARHGRKGGGVGLGLALCQELVTAHGSSIKLQSTVNVGSCFSFMLMRANARDNRSSLDRRSSQRSIGTISQGGRPRTISLEEYSEDLESCETDVICLRNSASAQRQVFEHNNGVQTSKATTIMSRPSRLSSISKGDKDEGPVCFGLDDTGSGSLSPLMHHHLEKMGQAGHSSSWGHMPSPIMNTPVVRSYSWKSGITKRTSVIDVVQDCMDSPARQDKNNEPIRVLVVDDNDNNLLVMSNMLTPNGFVVEQLKSGEECLEYLHARVGTLDVPDLVLLDVMMEGITGVETCAEIRRLRGMAEHELPVILVTASEDDSLMQNGMLAGATDYVQKPFTLSVLLARVWSALRLRELFKATVQRERDRSLLRRMLPESIIERLEGGQNLIADHHDSVTVLFSDIVGFTALSQSCSTSALMLMLNELFSAFDQALDRHGIYKVETIGDAYMCVAGHDGTTNHAERMAAFAVDMLTACERVKAPMSRESGITTKLQIRIGMNSGPVHAGVVGTRCPRYCFFGDTVNTASRMESTSFPMAVHLSSATASLLSGSKSTETIVLGPRFIKGKGIMNTHLLCVGDYLGACREFAMMQEKKNCNEENSSSPETLKEEESLVSRLHDTDTWILDSLGASHPESKGRGERSLQRISRTSSAFESDLPSIPRRLGDKLFDSVDSGFRKLDRKRLSSAFQDNGCCAASAMLWSEDTVDSRCSGEGSIHISLADGEDEHVSSEPGQRKASLPLNSLAQSLQLPFKDVEVLNQSAMTLSKLERLRTTDLNFLGFSNTMNAINLLRSAAALNTLRSFRGNAPLNSVRQMDLKSSLNSVHSSME